MFEPAYKNEFDKPVYSVYTLHMKRIKYSKNIYELQLNDQYFQISEEQIELLEAVTKLPDNISISMG